MRYSRFAVFNVSGGLAWILSFSFLGYFFGNLPAVKRNFTFVLVAIIVISVLPVALELWRARREARGSAKKAPAKEVAQP
jgi:membrane-associated protein